MDENDESLVFVTFWDCRTHVPMTSSVERTDLDFKISVALLSTLIFSKTGIKIKLLLLIIIYYLHFIKKKIVSNCGICIIAFIVFLSLVDSQMLGHINLKLIFLFYHIKSVKVNSIELEWKKCIN